MSWWGSYGRGGSIEGFSGEHGAGERAQKRSMTQCRAVFNKTPVSIIFDVKGLYLIFRFVGKETQVGEGVPTNLMRIGPHPRSRYLPYFINSDQQGTKIELYRIDTTPHCVETPN